MASLTKKTENVRRRKEAARGKRRKAAIRRNGSTPAFAVHSPEATANAAAVSAAEPAPAPVAAATVEE